MSESAVGRTSAATRQKAGAWVSGVEGASGLGGGTNDPAGTIAATVMVAPGRGRALRLSQEAASAGMAASAASGSVDRIMNESLLQDALEFSEDAEAFLVC